MNIHSDNPKTLSKLGLLYFKKKKIGESISFYMKAANLSASNQIKAIMYNNIALLYLLKNDSSHAQKYIESALKLHPTNRIIIDNEKRVIEGNKIVQLFEKQLPFRHREDSSYNIITFEKTAA